MVDASAMGTVCMKIKHKRDMELLLDSIGGENGLELMKDLTIGDADNMDLIDAGKSWAMVNDKAFTNLEEGVAELRQAHGLIAANGRFQRTVKLAFFNMKAVNCSVGDLAGKLKDQDEAKKKKEKDEAEAEEARLEAEEDAKDIGGTLSYYPTARDWNVDQTAENDTRGQNPNVVAGGAPKCLESSQEKVLKRDKTSKDYRPMTKYMTGEPNRFGDFKVYVEDPDVIIASESSISVDFKTKSYTVRCETGAIPVVLGPVECGQLDIKASSWKLSPGKRLTISLVKARTDARNRTEEQQVADAMAASAKKNDPAAQDASGTVSALWGTLMSLFPVLAGLVYLLYFKQS